MAEIAYFHDCVRKNSAPTEITPHSALESLAIALQEVEAAKTSGTLKTIDHAQDQGRDVLAIPGNITSDKSYTPNHLIQEGCTLVMEYSDVMQWFGWRETKGAKDRSIHLEGMDIQEKSVYNVIDNNGSRFDEIQFKLDYTPVQLISLLSRLEIKGLIIKLPGTRIITNERSNYCWCRAGRL